MKNFNVTEKLHQFFRWYAEEVKQIPHEKYDQKDFGRDVLGIAKSTTNAYFTGTLKVLPKKYYPVLSKILNQHNLPKFEDWKGYKSTDKLETVSKEEMRDRRRRIADVFNAMLKDSTFSRVELGKMFVGHYSSPDQFINGLLQGRYNTERILPKLYKLSFTLKGRDGLWLANPHYIEAIKNTQSMFIPIEGDQLGYILESPEALKTLHKRTGETIKLLSEIEKLTAQLIK